jgi:hypothetical protein
MMAILDISIAAWKRRQAKLAGEPEEPDEEAGCATACANCEIVAPCASLSSMAQGGDK